MRDIACPATAFPPVPGIEGGSARRRSRLLDSAGAPPMRIRLLPRFGLLTLFAAMLLLVSVAGWAKYHVDLKHEEDALLADLAKAGVGVVFGRSDEDLAVTASGSGDPETTWDLAQTLRPYGLR